MIAEEMFDTIRRLHKENGGNPVTLSGISFACGVKGREMKYLIKSLCDKKMIREVSFQMFEPLNAADGEVAKVKSEQNTLF